MIMLLSMIMKDFSTYERIILRQEKTLRRSMMDNSKKLRLF